jgi:hypothetical protein
MYVQSNHNNIIADPGIEIENRESFRKATKKSSLEKISVNYHPKFYKIE